MKANGELIGGERWERRPLAGFSEPPAGRRRSQASVLLVHGLRRVFRNALQVYLEHLQKCRGRKTEYEAPTAGRRGVKPLLQLATVLFERSKPL